jgi:hypothetical protein
MRAIVLALAALVAACSTLGPQRSDSEQVDRVLAEALQLRKEGIAAQRTSLTRARQAFSARRDDVNQLRLGTLLATLPPPLGDEGQSMALLKPLASRRPETAVTRLASLLVLQLSERQRLEQAEQRGAQALRESAQALRQSEEQAGELRHKLDELKSIERSVLQREEQLHVE